MKKIEAEEVPAMIGPTSTVGLGNACAEPQTLIDAFIRGKDSFDSIVVVGMIHYWTARLLADQGSDVLKFRMFWIDRYTSPGFRKGVVDYIPCRYSQLPRLFQSGDIRVDTALISVSPPDQSGYCSFGVSTDYTKAMAESARVVIAEINAQMPRVLGDNFIHVSKIDYFIESDRSLPQIPPAELKEIDRGIASHASELIEDGATIQIGIGSLSAAILDALRSKVHLGVHSGLITDGVVELMQSGVIDNSRKGLLDGKTVGTTMIGTDKLFEFVDDNPAVESYPSDFTHSAATLARIVNLRAINSAIQVDLLGQVNAETMRGIQVSGVGGHADFCCGAGLSRNGRSIVVLPSSTSDQARSRIVPCLEQGASVTSPRHDIDYVVTEYGIAQLRGRTIRERARALASIAHPKFREALEYRAVRIV